MKKYDVFISYSRRDYSLALDVYNTLKQQGLIVFLDSQDLEFGENFAFKIADTIKQCHSLICIISDDLIKSQFNRRQIEYAKSLNKHIYAVTAGGYNSGQLNWLTAIVSQTNIIPYCELKSVINNIFQSHTHPKHAHEPHAKYSYRKTKSKWCFIITIIITCALFLGIIFFSLPRACYSTNDEVYATPFDEYNDTTIIPCDTIVADSCSSNFIFNDYTEKSESHIPIDIIDTSSDNYEPIYNYNGIYIFTSIVFAFIILLIVIRKRKICVKLHCNCPSDVYIDNKLVATLKADIVHKISLKKGDYMFKFCSIKDENVYKSFKHEINKSNELINIELKPTSGSSKKETVKCFIAGSTKLQEERNALRAGIAQVHNSWEKKNKFEILSYTYEDFDRVVVLGGQQNQYNLFLCNEAKLAIFIISGKVGEKTIEEFDIAVDALNNHGNPQIIIFNDAKSEISTAGLELQKRANDLNQYWIEYNSLKELKDQFMIELQWLLINLYS